MGWYESKIDLMTQIKVFGSRILSSSVYDIGVDNKQYAIFQLKPELINSNMTNKNSYHYWLKEIANEKGFAYVSADGTSYSANASFAYYGVRPRFLIG